MARRQQNRDNAGCPRSGQRNAEDQGSNDTSGEGAYNPEEFLQNVGQSVAAMLDPLG